MLCCPPGRREQSGALLSLPHCCVSPTCRLYLPSDSRLATSLTALGAPSSDSICVTSCTTSRQRDGPTDRQADVQTPRYRSTMGDGAGLVLGGRARWSVTWCAALGEVMVGGGLRELCSVRSKSSSSAPSMRFRPSTVKPCRRHQQAQVGQAGGRKASDHCCHACEANCQAELGATSHLIMI